VVHIIVKIFDEVPLLRQLGVDLSTLLFQALGDVVDLVKSLVLFFQLFLMIGLH
jgi:hypothetical protein